MRMLGFLLSLSVLVLAMAFGSSVAIFFNLPSAIIVLCIGLGTVAFGHGVPSIGLLVRAAFGKVELGHTDEAATVAQTASQSFVQAGWIGFLIGAVQMLANLDDPAKVGPAVAVALLTVFYGYTCSTLLWLPAHRRMACQAD